MNKQLSLFGLLIGITISGLLLDSPIARWIIISTAILLLLLAYWEAKQIRTHLPNEKLPKKTIAFKPLVFRLSLWVLLIAVGLMIEAIWWAQQQRLQPFSYKEDVVNSSLPLSMSLQKVSWQLGIRPYPDLVNIPAGDFIMGDDSSERDSEKPSHKVTLKAFQMSQTEVTFAQYDYYIWQLKQQDSNNPDAYYPDDENW